MESGSLTLERVFVGLGALSALVSVAAGAFGAHALRERLTPDMLAVFETAARYQMYHALGLLAVFTISGTVLIQVVRRVWK